MALNLYPYLALIFVGILIWEDHQLPISLSLGGYSVRWKSKLQGAYFKSALWVYAFNLGGYSQSKEVCGTIDLSQLLSRRNINLASNTRCTIHHMTELCTLKSRTVW